MGGIVVAQMSGWVVSEQYILTPGKSQLEKKHRRVFYVRPFLEGKQLLQTLIHYF